ncbi:hypothetical protein ACFCX4_32665 [Kitasatospora sp. NPDC056327]|uniref:hypothetical protein n=1 Tax=Kitasatospora sp. NPDC056327 TaxID=3345785 RepID=UPI0035E08DB9
MERPETGALRLIGERGDCSPDLCSRERPECCAATGPGCLEIGISGAEVLGEYDVTPFVVEEGGRAVEVETVRDTAPPSLYVTLVGDDGE